MAQIAYALVWWLVVTVIGLAAFPIVSRVCGGLQDRGYAISRIVGLLLVMYFSWLLASAKLVKFGYANIAISLVLLLAISLLLGRKRWDLRNLPLRSIVITEVLFAASFILFLLIISHKSDFTLLYSEDFMDFGFLNSILRSDFFPPADPWLSGESIPYYHGGHVVTAVLIKLSRVPPSIGYNLAVAMFFALAVCAAYGLGYNVTKRKLFGFVTVLFVCIAGFISGAFQLVAFLKHQPVMGYTPLDAPNIGEWFLSFDFVTANRIIENVVNHYPSYAFLVGDLHANVMDISFQLMFITLLLSLVVKGEPAPESSRTDSLLKVIILSLALGFLAFVNTWSFPVYLGVFVLAFILLKMRIKWKAFLAVIGLSLLLYLPYYISRGSGAVQGLGLVDNSTDLIEFVEIFALSLFAMFSLLLVLFKDNVFTRRAFMIGAIVMFAVGLGAFLAHFQLILIIVPLTLVPLYYIWKNRPGDETHFMLVLVMAGALVVLLFEVFFIDDALGPPNDRYNTLLKMYMPVWVIWGVASAYAVFHVASRMKGVIRAVWALALLLIVLSCLIHPLASTISWASGRYSLVEGQRLTLDGLAYLETTNREDYEAIRWLNENVEGSKVILEAPGEVYKYSSRVSAFTGLPTLLGWAGWEVMWRGSWDIITERTFATDTIYRTTDDSEAEALLRKYDVVYIYVGMLEKERYGDQGLLKFSNQPDRYKLVYENQDVSIYQVIS
ncbi:DUF2298 domain-containing protein [Chloroflexota bacterium]